MNILTGPPAVLSSAIVAVGGGGCRPSLLARASGIRSCGDSV